MAEPLITQIDFLRLLTTQLEYQNPLDPMDNVTFISQMAQFSNLQQIINLNENFIKYAEKSDKSFESLNTFVVQNQALSLLNRKVDFIDSTTNESKTGTVNKVRFVEGMPLITVTTDAQETLEIALSDIFTVYAFS